MIASGRRLTVTACILHISCFGPFSRSLQINALRSVARFHRDSADFVVVVVVVLVLLLLLLLLLLRVVI